MTTRTPVKFKLGEREFAFDLNIDPGYIADINTLDCMRANGCCEPEVAHLMARVVAKGDRVIDIGANIGFFTLFLSQLVGRTGTVIAFEPAPNTFTKLNENIKLNRLTNVLLNQQALWDKVEAVKLYLAADSGTATLSRAPDSVGSIKLTTRTLDSVAEFLDQGSYRLIKMDAEGAELNIILGGSHLVDPAQVPYIVSELNDEALHRFKTSAKEFRGWMKSRGYDTFILHTQGLLPILLPEATQVRSNRQNVNVLFSTVEHVGAAWPEIVA